MDILDDTGVSKLSEKGFLKVNYSFKGIVHPKLIIIYSPANCSKPVCVYLNTKEYIWKNVSNQTVVAFIAFFFLSLKSMVTIQCLITNILQNIFFSV